MAAQTAILFARLGNICRSPLAEAAFRRVADREGLDVVIDSAGSGDWHVGGPPDPRAQALTKRYGIDITAYRARQVTKDDFASFSRIIALDEKNLAALENLRPHDARAEISLLLDHIEAAPGKPWQIHISGTRPGSRSPGPTSPAAQKPSP